GRPRPAPLQRQLVLLVAGPAARGLVDAVGVDAAVDPAPAPGGAVARELGVRRQESAVGAAAVDLGEDVLGIGLVGARLHRVVPGQLLQGAVPRIGGVGQTLLEDAAQVVVEPQFAAGVPGRLHGLVAPLEHALGVGEGALLLHVVGGREVEDLGADLLRAHHAGLDLGARLPEIGALDHHEVADDQPVQVRQAGALHAAVGRAHGRVLAHEEVTATALVDLALHGRGGIVFSGEAG